MDVFGVQDLIMKLRLDVDVDRRRGVSRLANLHEQGYLHFQGLCYFLSRVYPPIHNTTYNPVSLSVLKLFPCPRVQTLKKQQEINTVAFISSKHGIQIVHKVIRVFIIGTSLLHPLLQQAFCSPIASVFLRVQLRRTRPLIVRVPASQARLVGFSHYTAWHVNQHLLGIEYIR